MKALEDTVLLAEMLAVAGIFQPISSKSLLGMSNAPICDVVEPRLEEGSSERTAMQFSYTIGSVGSRNARTVLKLSPITRTWRNRVGFHPEMQIPGDVEIVVKIMSHKRLIGEASIEQLVEKATTLSPYIGRYRSEVTADM